MDNETLWEIRGLNTSGRLFHLLLLLCAEAPDIVSLSFVNHTGSLLLEHHQYTLWCTVHNVAPAGNLLVTFYRGQTQLVQRHSNVTEKTPVTEVFTLDIVPRREDDGNDYWCEAELQLYPTGTQQRVAVASEKVTTTVLCK